jgi:thymidylate synthase (FAD)
MRVIAPTARFEDEIDGAAIIKKIELCGRVCYKSEDKIKADSANEFVRKIIARGHESVLEHVSLTARFICDRGVTHEIVRHRIASYSQESTRYCNYGGGEVVFIKPCFCEEGSPEYEVWHEACRLSEEYYNKMLNMGMTPQLARSVLPNSLKTELIMTANLREWRHFFKLRLSSGAHVQMREVARILFEEAKSKIPVIFDDIK